MKFTLYILAFAFFALGFSSCKKCYTCTVLDDENSSVFTYPEICGTKRDFKDYESRCEAEYGSFDFTCSCGLSE